jgi:hypothetical protein
MYLVRLIYASQVSPGFSAEDIRSLLTLCRDNNSRESLTGVLCFDSEFFLQCLEGPRHAVNSLYTHILRDKRHQQVTLMGYQEISRREFPEWSMAYVGLDQTNRDILMRYSVYNYFDPFSMSGDSALGLLSELYRRYRGQPE